MNVSLTSRLEQFTHSLVESSRYRSASEVLREALRLLEDREAEKAGERRLVLEGLESGEPVSLSKDDIRDLIGQRMSELRDTPSAPEA